MIAVDTNVLVHAHRQGASHHAAAAAWLRHLAEGPAPWGLPVFVLGEFVRVVTHPRIFPEPSSLAAALDFLTALLESPTARLLNPGRRFAALLAAQATAAEARGNLVFDAQIAAVCIETGADRLLTRDRDFHRFPGRRGAGAGGPAAGLTGRAPAVSKPPAQRLRRSRLARASCSMRFFAAAQEQIGQLARSW